MEQELTLRYCYRYEPGFDIFSLWDIILYKDDADSDISDNVYQYLKKEEELIEKEDMFLVFYRAKHFKFKIEANIVGFLRLELYPEKAKDDSVLNLVYVPINKEWKDLSNVEQLMMIDEEVKNQERLVDFNYKLVNYSIEYVEIDDEPFVELDETFIEADELPE